MKKFSSDETKRNDATLVSLYFPPLWLAALKTIETQTPVHLVDLLIDLRDLFRIASGGGKKNCITRVAFKLSRRSFSFFPLDLL